MKMMRTSECFSTLHDFFSMFYSLSLFFVLCVSLCVSVSGIFANLWILCLDAVLKFFLGVRVGVSAYVNLPRSSAFVEV